MLPKTSRWRVDLVTDLDTPATGTLVTMTVRRDWPVWRWFFKPRVVITLGETVYSGRLDRKTGKVGGDYLGLGPFGLEVLPPDSVHPGRWLRCLVDLHDPTNRQGHPMTTGTWTADEDGP